MEKVALILAITSHATRQNWKSVQIVISNGQSFIFQVLKLQIPWESLIFSVPETSKRSSIRSKLQNVI